MASNSPRRGVGLQRAFDEARFGNDRTLNLRDRLPTAEYSS